MKIQSPLATTQLLVSGNAIISGNLEVTDDILPSVPNEISIGSEENRFKDIYLSGSTIYLGNVKISESEEGTLQVIDANEEVVVVGEVDTGSIDLRLDALEVESGSVRTELNNYTSSIDTKISSLEEESGSIRLALNNFTGSSGVISGSTQFDNLNDPFTGSFTGSFTGDGAGLTGIAASLAISGSTGSDTIDLKTSALTFAGDNGVTTAVTDDTLTISIPQGTVSASSQIDHNTTTNYIANEHIDHSTVNITAGEGISGGGDITTSRTLTLNTGSAHFTEGVKTKLNSDSVVSGSDVQVKTFLSLNNVDNTSDIDKPLSTAQKLYVDEVAQGLKTRSSARVLVDSNLNATYDNGVEGSGSFLESNTNGAFPTTDGIDSTELNVVGARILVIGQTNKEENGLYVLQTPGNSETPWKIRRCRECDSSQEVPGSFIFIKSGTVYGNTGWVLLVDDPATFTIGTDDINPQQFSGAGSFLAGNGLGLDGNIFSLDTGSVHFNTGVKTKLNIDGVISGSGQIDINSTSGTLSINKGGTGATSQQAAINALAGAVTAGQYLRGNGTNVVMSAIQAGDVPTLNQNTTGNAATATTLQTARTINGTSFNGSANITTANWGTARNISIGGTSKSVNGSGNVTWATSEIAAQTAVTLATARTINGVSFNGSANITLPTVNTSGNQSIGGVKTFTNRLLGNFTGGTTTNASVNFIGNNAGSGATTLNVQMETTSNARNLITATNNNGVVFRVRGDGSIVGNGSGLATLNASNLSSGTVATARLPAAALIGDTTYSAGNGISLTGTTFSVAGGDGLTQQASGLAVDNTVVRTSGNQSISGTKTFTGPVSINTSGGCCQDVALQLNNQNISGINHLKIADPGPREGLEWVGGSGWCIDESPDNRTNTGGNLQFVTGITNGTGTRRATMYTNGDFWFGGTLTGGTVPWARLSGVPTTLSGTVNTSGNQTVAGTKTFSSAVVLSTAGTATNHAVRADRTITTGDGLSGGGNLTANRTFAVDSTVVRTSGNQSISGTKTFTGQVRAEIVQKTTSGAFAVRSATSNLRLGGNSNVRIYTGSTSSSDGTERMRVISTGVGIGTTAPSQALHVVGQIVATNNITAFFSDERLKTKTGKITNATKIINNLSTFKYIPNDIAKSHGYTEETEYIGLSAQEVQKVLPEVVTLAPFDQARDENGNLISKTGENYLTLDYGKLVPVLIEAIKEQQHQIDTYKSEVDELKDFIDNIT